MLLNYTYIHCPYKPLKLCYDNTVSFITNHHGLKKITYKDKTMQEMNDEVAPSHRQGGVSLRQQQT